MSLIELYFFVVKEWLHRHSSPYRVLRESYTLFYYASRPHVSRHNGSLPGFADE